MNFKLPGKLLYFKGQGVSRKRLRSIEVARIFPAGVGEAGVHSLILFKVDYLC